MSAEDLPKQVPPLGRVLVVDDEEALTRVLCARLQEQGYAATGVTSGAEALAALRAQEFEVLLCDLTMPEMDGTALLQASLEIDPHLVGVMMTGQGTIESAVEAMKQGACDYVLKPFKLAELLPVLAKAVELHRLRLENIDLHQTLGLYELTTTLRFTQNLNTILDKTAEVTLQQLGVDEVSIMLPTQDGKELFVAAVRGGQRDHLLGQRVPCGEGIAGWVAHHREFLALEGPVQEGRFGEHHPRADIGTSLSLPMLAAGQLVGVLNLNDTSRHRPFTSGEIKALQLLTSIAAEALDASRSSAQARAAESQYRAIFDNAVVGIFQATPEGRFLKANLTHARMLGYDSPEELLSAVTDIGQQVYADPQRREELKQRLATEGKVQAFEIEARRQDGSTLWALMSARAFHDTGGAILYYEGMVEDVTERRQAEQALRESEERYRRLAENARDIIYRLRLHPSLGFEYASPSATAITGYTPEEHYADPDIGQKLIHPDDQPLLLAAMVQPGSAVEPLLLRWIHKDGRIIWGEHRIALLRDDTGRLVAVEGIARDITVQRQEAVRRQAVQQVREAVRAMQVAEDLDQVVLAVERGLRDLELPFREMAINRVEPHNPGQVVSPHAEKQAGDPQSLDAGTRTILQIWRAGQVDYRPDLEAEDLYGEREHIAACYGGLRRSVLDVPFSHGTLAVNSDRARAFTPDHITLVKDLAEVLAEGFQRQEDLRRLKEAQQQFYQSQKLEALGRLAGGVAHDFNNLITVIDGYSRLALKQLPQDDSMLRSAVEEVQRAGERAEALVRQLLAFSRRQSIERRTLDLNLLVSEVQRMLGRLIGEDVDLSVQLALKAGTVEADPGQLEQILMNLAVNARDAMPEGGQLTIETASCQLDEVGASSLGLEAGGQYCRLVIRDTGVGMSAEVQQHIFEPFFTTKEAGRGTGLGLATVYGIVKEHRGSIQVRSQQGQGTSFEIYLPAAAGGEQERVQQDQASVQRGAETILLVEDDPKVRHLIARLLGELGYTVLEAERGDTALQICRRPAQTIELLLTDVMMPGMSGYVLVEQARTMCPGMKVLYMSGYAGKSGPPQGEEVNFLPKPFTIETLARAVRQALESV